MKVGRREVTTIAEGLKQTPVGPVPEDWTVATIGDIASTSSGTTPSRALFDRYYANGSINWAKTLDLHGAEIEDTDERVTPVALEETSLRLYPAGTVLVAMYGGFNQIGRTGLLRKPAAVNQAISAIQVSPTKLCPDYLLAVLNLSVHHWKSVASSSRKDPNITGTDVRGFPIAIPPMNEQRAIAAALRDIASLTRSLDALIAKKRDLKQAAMQQLLTARSRLRGFEGAWQTAKLGALGRFLKGSGVKRDEATSGDLPCVRYGELYTQHHDYIRSFGSWISESVARTAVPVRYGDILFAGSGETKQEIGKCAAVVGAPEAYAGGDIVIFRPYEADPLFLGYYLNTPAISTQKASLGQGDAVVHISATALASIDVCIPSSKEQSALGKVLSDFDTEIDALQARLEKLRALKQAMMQQLLTGRIRLI